VKTSYNCSKLLAVNKSTLKSVERHFVSEKAPLCLSPAPKAWNNPKLIGYFDALAKLPDLLGPTADPLPELTGAFQRTALWLTALPAVVIAAGRSLLAVLGAAGGRGRSHGARKLLLRGKTTPRSRRGVTEIEKRFASPTFDVDAIKLAEGNAGAPGRSARGGAIASAGAVGGPAA